jgi:hypothetical protein
VTAKEVLQALEIGANAFGRGGLITGALILNEEMEAVDVPFEPPGDEPGAQARRP